MNPSNDAPCPHHEHENQTINNLSALVRQADEALHVAVETIKVWHDSLPANRHVAQADIDREWKLYHNGSPEMLKIRAAIIAIGNAYVRKAKMPPTTPTQTQG